MLTIAPYTVDTMRELAEKLKKSPSWKVRKLGFLFDRIAAQTLEEKLEIPFAQFKLLMVLRRHGAVAQKAIARFHGMTEAAISRQVEPLRRQKLVTTRVNPDNRRVHLLTLTDRGKAQTDKALRLLDEKFTVLFRVLKPREKAQFTATIDRLLAAIWQERGRWFCGPRAVEKYSKK